VPLGCTDAHGFSLHAAVRCAAHQRKRHERCAAISPARRSRHARVLRTFGSPAQGALVRLLL
jgi:hypothetical protein